MCLSEGERRQYLTALSRYPRTRPQSFHPRRLPHCWACTPFLPPAEEARAWTVPIGATALQADRVIHTDFKHGSIRAEVIAYDDFPSSTARTGRRKPASGGWKVRNTSLVTAMSCISGSRFSTYGAEVRFSSAVSPVAVRRS